MLKAAKNITAGLMMAILFVASSGFTLFSHICLMGGDQKISATQIESCCLLESKAATSELRSDCCDDRAEFIKFDITSLIVKYQVQPQLISSDLIFPAFSIHNETLNTASLSYNNLPPPKSGREILSSIQIFRI